MKGGYELRWTQAAYEDLRQVIEYLEQNWSPREIAVFVNTLHHRLLLIQTFPCLFEIARTQPNVHRSVLTKQTTIYYQVNDADHTIVVLRLWDNRQDPEKLLL